MREPEMTQELQAELHQGVLVRFFGGFYVAADADGQEYTLRCPKKFRHQRLSPLVGDAVRFTPGQGEEEGWLVEILPRKTECIRPPVANVTLLLVSICPSPEPDLLLVDRLLARAKKQGMKTALIVGKCDLDGGKLLAQMQEEYRGADCPVLGVSARNKEGLDSVRALMRGADCCCLAGQSGVGKSTLLNALLDLQLETGEISEKIQRGKNTTRYAQLLIHDGIRVLDTAGRAWSRKNCRNCTRNFSRTSGSVASSPACMTANPAVPSRRRCRREKLTETGWRGIGNCWRMSGWRGRIGISDIKANEITPACEPMLAAYRGDFLFTFSSVSPQRTPQTFHPV